MLVILTTVAAKFNVSNLPELPTGTNTVEPMATKLSSPVQTTWYDRVIWFVLSRCGPIHDKNNPSDVVALEMNTKVGSISVGRSVGINKEKVSSIGSTVTPQHNHIRLVGRELMF